MFALADPRKRFLTSASLLCASSFLCSVLTPLPVPNFRHILAVFIDIVFVLDEFVLHLLLQVGALGIQMRQPIDHVLDQVEFGKEFLFS